MDLIHSRRRFMQGVAFSATAFTMPGAFAEQLELVQTARMTEGPFYPNRLPLDTDNDLLLVNDRLTPAVGRITHLSGRVLDIQGNPVRNAIVEVWQVDNNGSYLHTDSARRGEFDTNFQGFGRFLTNAKGEYYFRTIKPVAYGSRTPHIHFAVNLGGKRTLTTQCFIKGEPQNQRDGLYNRLRDKKVRDSVTVDFAPMQNSKLGELTAHFDIVLGITPEA